MFRKSLLPLLFITILALFLRTVFLSEAPIGLNHDEITFVTNAKAVAFTGLDLSGTWSPFSLTPISYGFPMSELPFLIVSPFMELTQSSPFAARLPYAIFGTLLVVVLYFIARKLLGEPQAIAVGLVAALNPWGIMFSRTTFDSPLAILFYMLAFLLIINVKGSKVLLSFIPLFIAFYSYIGTKIILVPFVVVISYFSWILSGKKNTKYYLLLIALCAVLLGSFIFSLKTQTTGTRISDITTPFSSSITQGVDIERNLTIATPFTNVFSNKFVYYVKDFSYKYVGILSPTYQFFSGDKDMHLSLWFHGYFYYLDLIFLILGFCYLFQKNKQYWIGIVALILISPLPSAFHTGDGSYVTRGVLIFPVFILLIGLGIVFFLDLFKKRTRVFMMGLLGLVYLVLLLNFINVYFFRFPMFNSEGPDFSSRVLSRYAVLASEIKDNKVFVYTNEPDAFYKDYLFFANAYTRKNTKEVAKHFLDHNFSLNNVYFKKGCPGDVDFSVNTTIIIANIKNCSSNKVFNTDSLHISQLGDNAHIYNIYNDKVCKNYKINDFAQNINFFDFNIEKITTKTFCEKFIYKK